MPTLNASRLLAPPFSSGRSLRRSPYWPMGGDPRRSAGWPAIEFFVADRLPRGVQGWVGGGLLRRLPHGAGRARVGYDAKGSVFGTAKGGDSSEPQASESFY